MKPWDLAPAARTSPAARVPSAQPSASATSSPTIRPSLALCFSTEDWRLVTVEQSEDREIRTWIAVEPTAATGASDPRLEPVRVVAARVVGLGFCAPDRAADAMNPATTFVWVPGGAQAEVPFRDLDPLRGYDSGVGAGQAYEPPATVRRAGGGWPPGRYAIELRSPRRGERSLWFAFRIVTAGAARPTPSPP